MGYLLVWETLSLFKPPSPEGFEDVRVFRAIEDLRMSGHYGIGRVYICACRSTSRHFGTV